jgi:hypothetical protein
MDEDTVGDVNNLRVEPAWQSPSVLRSAEAAVLRPVLSVVVTVNASSRAPRA